MLSDRSIQIKIIDIIAYKQTIWMCHMRSEKQSFLWSNCAPNPSQQPRTHKHNMHLYTLILLSNIYTLLPTHNNSQSKGKMYRYIGDVAAAAVIIQENDAILSFFQQKSFVFMGTWEKSFYTHVLLIYLFALATICGRRAYVYVLRLCPVQWKKCMHKNTLYHAHYIEYKMDVVETVLFYFIYYCLCVCVCVCSLPFHKCI